MKCSRLHLIRYTLANSPCISNLDKSQQNCVHDSIRLEVRNLSLFVLVNWWFNTKSSGSDRCERRGCWMLPAAGWTFSESPTSLPHPLPPPSSSFRAEEHKLSNTSTAAHISSVLQLSASRFHTEGFQWAQNKHTPPTSHFLFHTLNSAANTQQHFFLPLHIVTFFNHPNMFDSLYSRQVDISFISQEVFDRSFYEEMYPPAAPVATAQQQLNQLPPKDLQQIEKNNNDLGNSLSWPTSGPFHFTKKLLFFVLLKNANIILQCLELHLEERPSLYFAFVGLIVLFFQRWGTHFKTQRRLWTPVLLFKRSSNFSKGVLGVFIAGRTDRQSNRQLDTYSLDWRSCF